MNKVLAKIGKGIETIFTVFGTLLALSVAISWGVSVVYLSYGLAIWSFQWFNGLI